MGLIIRNDLTDYEWSQGNLRWLLRQHGQARVNKFVEEQEQIPNTVEPIIFNAHRRMGKSFYCVAKGVERCLQRPDQRVKYIAGSYEQVRDIVVPLFDQIMESAPPPCRPKKINYEYYFRSPNWGLASDHYSVFKLIGANYKKGDMGRGAACDLAVLDEVRDYTSLQYFWESVLIHQFIGREDPQCLMCSTPPKSMDHDFTRPAGGFIPRAIERGRYIVIRGSENPDFTERDAQLVEQSINGGRDSVAWRREIECELISDEEDLITPEYSRGKAEMAVNEYVRPDYYQPYEVMDTGYDPDFTAILFGYVDWWAALLIFEGEIFKRRMTTRDIADGVRAKEEELGYHKAKHPIIRVADMDPRGLEDLRRDYRLSFGPAIKYNAESALSAFRSRLQNRQVRVIVPACPNLDYQLEHGVWQENKKDFIRSDTMGHWDAGKAAVYLNRKISWRSNPVPPNALSPIRREKRLIGLSWADTISKVLGRS